jgi:hypothetical protein
MASNFAPAVSGHSDDSASSVRFEIALPFAGVVSERLSLAEDGAFLSYASNSAFLPL